MINFIPNQNRSCICPKYLYLKRNKAKKSKDSASYSPRYKKIKTNYPKKRKSPHAFKDINKRNIKIKIRLFASCIIYLFIDQRLHLATKSTASNYPSTIA